MAVIEVIVQPARLLLSLSVSVSIIWTVKRSLAVRDPPSAVSIDLPLAAAVATFEALDSDS